MCRSNLEMEKIRVIEMKYSFLILSLWIYLNSFKIDLFYLKELQREKESYRERETENCNKVAKVDTIWLHLLMLH